jgi:hypothetical protein
MVKAAFDITLYHLPLHPVVQVDGAVPDRIHRPACGTISGAAIQTILCIDGR